MADKVLLDTTVLVDILRNGRLPSGWEDCQKFISAVSALELWAGARKKEDAGAVQKLLAAFSDLGRIVVPFSSGYTAAGKTIAHLGRATLPVFRDALIAESARQIGAALWTSNRVDFEPIARWRGIPVRFIG